MYQQIVCLSNAVRHQLITRALLARGWRAFISFLRRIKLRRASDYENFEAAAKREERGEKRAAVRVVR